MGLSKWLQQKKSLTIKNFEKKNVHTWVGECKESFSKGFIVVAGFCYREKSKMSEKKRLKSTHHIIRMCYVWYLQKKYHFFKNLNAFLTKWNCIKTKPLIILQKLPIYSLKKMKNCPSIGYILYTFISIYIYFNIYLQSPLSFHLLVCWKELYWSTHTHTMIKELWKIVKQEQQAIPQEILCKALLASKKWYRFIIQKQDYQMKHLNN